MGICFLFRAVVQYYVIYFAAQIVLSWPLEASLAVFFLMRSHVFCLVFKHFITFWNNGCSKLMLHISCSSLYIVYFSLEPSFIYRMDSSRHKSKSGCLVTAGMSLLVVTLNRKNKITYLY